MRENAARGREALFVLIDEGDYHVFPSGDDRWILSFEGIFKASDILRKVRWMKGLSNEEQARCDQVIGQLDWLARRLLPSRATYEGGRHRVRPRG